MEPSAVASRTARTVLACRPLQRSAHEAQPEVPRDPGGIGGGAELPGMGVTA